MIFTVSPACVEGVATCLRALASVSFDLDGNTFTVTIYDASAGERAAKVRATVLSLDPDAVEA